jgi:hypothetical protein
VLVYSNGSGIFTWDFEHDQLPPTSDPDIKIPKIPNGSLAGLYSTRLRNWDYLILEDTNGESTIYDVSTNSSVSEPIKGKFLPIHSQDLGFLMYIDSGGNLIQWDLNPEGWVKQLCKVVGRNFTKREWKQYFPGENYFSTQSDATCPQWPLEPEVTKTPIP